MYTLDYFIFLFFSRSIGFICCVYISLSLPLIHVILFDLVSLKEIESLFWKADLCLDVCQKFGLITSMYTSLFLIPYEEKKINEDWIFCFRYSRWKLSCHLEGISKMRLVRTVGPMKTDLKSQSVLEKCRNKRSFGLSLMSSQTSFFFSVRIFRYFPFFFYLVTLKEGISHLRATSISTWSVEFPLSGIDWVTHTMRCIWCGTLWRGEIFRMIATSITFFHTFLAVIDWCSMWAILLLSSLYRFSPPSLSYSHSHQWLKKRMKEKTPRIQFPSDIYDDCRRVECSVIVPVLSLPLTVEAILSVMIFYIIHRYGSS